MPNRKFLNPYVRLILCLLGIIVMAYFLYPSIRSGGPYDSLFTARAIALAGFTYLFIKSLGHFFGSGNNNESS